MAARQITTTQTLEDFRVQFNALSATDFGDIATLDSNLTAIVLPIPSLVCSVCDPTNVKKKKSIAAPAISTNIQLNVTSICAFFI